MPFHIDINDIDDTYYIVKTKSDELKKYMILNNFKLLGNIMEIETIDDIKKLEIVMQNFHYFTAAELEKRFNRFYRVLKPSPEVLSSDDIECPS